MKTEITCKSCKDKFEVAYNMIERKVKSRQDGKDLVLTIVTCPKCKKEMIVQIDNRETLKLYDKQLKLIRKAGETAYLKGKASVTQQKNLDELTGQLNKMRDDLVAKYDGSSYQFEGKVKKLEYHRPTVQVIGG